MKVFFTFISYLFHPLFMAVWMVVFLYFIDPVTSIYFNGLRGKQVATILALLMILIPLIIMKVLKEFGLIKSLEVKRKEERFTVYASVATLYLVNYQMLYQLGAPRTLRLAILGILVTLVSLALINRFFKISAHMAAVGGVVGFFVISCMHTDSYVLFLVLSLLLAGLIASSRLYLDAHNYFEITLGFMLGTIVMFTVFFFNWLPVL